MVGANTGVRVGKFDGASVVGEIVGFSVGSKDGDSVGELVGFFVGKAEGDSVVGAAVGFRVGELDGDNVISGLDGK